jgi:hypothetical protein
MRAGPLRGIPQRLSRQDLIETTGISPLEFLRAAQWTYFHDSRSPPSPFFKDENGVPLKMLDRSAGFYGAALKDSDQIIITFEGTDLFGDLRSDPLFVTAQLEADAQIYFGQIPQAFTVALQFAENVLAEADEQHIPRENIYVTGHSLGAAEAEYVAAHLDLGGATFGALALLLLPFLRTTRRNR